jgi:hypothetical protein
MPNTVHCQGLICCKAFNVFLANGKASRRRCPEELRSVSNLIKT